VAIDGTYLTAVPTEEVTKFEVVAGRVERDGTMGRRFACALPRRSMTQTLVAAALEQSGWAPQAEVNVMSDGAKGMRSLVEAVAPTLAKPTLDWFHLSMKIHALRSALGAYTMAPTPRSPFVAQSKRSANRICSLLWRGRTDEAIQLTTLITSLEAEAPKLPSFYPSAAEVSDDGRKAVSPQQDRHRERADRTGCRAPHDPELDRSRRPAAHRSAGRVPDDGADRSEHRGLHRAGCRTQKAHRATNAGCSDRFLRPAYARPRIQFEGIFQFRPEDHSPVWA
jgi:hypothetical protein